MGDHLIVPIFFILFAVAAASPYCQPQDGYICSRATYYGSPECPGNPHGACGYGEYAFAANNGLTGGVSRLYRNGSGCGACYQVKCKIPAHCSDEGVNVLVTDFAVGDYTDFVLNARAFAGLARPNMAAELMALGVVDIDFKRIPCRYGASNVMLQVHERSAFPHYLAIFPIYQAGVYDVIDVQLFVEECKEWRGMRRVFGTVFDMENPPRGPLVVRFQVSNAVTGEVKWVQVGSSIPSDWKAGVSYDTAVQFD